MAWDLDKGRERGINVQDVFESYADHLIKERKKVRENPKLLDLVKPDMGPFNLSVTQKPGASATYWTSLGELPHGVPAFTVFANSFDAALNKTTLRELLERRYFRELAITWIRAGVYPDDLDGRRDANRAARACKVYVADVAQARA